MHKTPIDLRRLLPFVLLTLFLLTPSLARAADSAQPAGIEQPPPTDQPTDIPRAGAVPALGYVYTVKAGDDIWLIAVSHGLNMEELATENNLEPPYWIYPGDKLWVPAEPAPVRRPTPAAPASARQSAGTSAAPVAIVSGSLTEDAALILNSMNEKRAAFGLAPLTWSDELASAAQSHANDLAQRGWGSHVGSDGARLRTRLQRVGYYASWASENWANSRNAQQAFDMWWFEPDWGPHRLNILGPYYSEVGIGVARGGWGYYYIADFGSR